MPPCPPLSPLQVVRVLVLEAEVPVSMTISEFCLSHRGSERAIEAEWHSHCSGWLPNRAQPRHMLEALILDDGHLPEQESHVGSEQ